MKLISVGVVALGCMCARADIVQIDIRGTVDFNVFTTGPFAGVPSGAPGSLRFQVDSNVFLNSPTLPTRGYPILQPSFVFQAGAGSTTLLNPFPAGQTPYFVLRNNDPAVDGFFISTGTGLPAPLPLAFNPNAGMNFLATYPGTTLSSLNILGAVGSYNLTGLSVFNWGIMVGPGDPLGMNYQSMTISVVPAPAGSLCLVGLLAWRRRR